MIQIELSLVLREVWPVALPVDLKEPLLATWRVVDKATYVPRDVGLAVRLVRVDTRPVVLHV